MERCDQVTGSLGGHSKQAVGAREMLMEETGENGYSR